MNPQSGYIALISAIIISLILITTVVALSAAIFFSRFDILDSEYKESSVALAEACIDSAILKLTLNPAYSPPSGGEPVAVGNKSCKIMSVTSSGLNKIIVTQGEDKKAYTNLKVTAKVSPLPATFSTWQECLTLTTAPCP